MKEAIAKFTVLTNQSKAWGEGKIVHDISATTVYDPNEESENGKFFAATPSGNLNLGVVNSDAAEVFGQPGDEILVTFKNLSAEKREEEESQKAAQETQD